MLVCNKLALLNMHAAARLPPSTSRYLPYVLGTTQEAPKPPFRHRLLIGREVFPVEKKCDVEKKCITIVKTDVRSDSFAVVSKNLKPNMW